MKLPLHVTENDRQFFENRLKDFLPDTMIDVHSHIWPDNKRDDGDVQRVVKWPSLVARVNPIEDHLESYRLLFPGKQVTPVVFSNLSNPDKIEAANAYVRQVADEHKLPALLYTPPDWSAEEMAQRVRAGGFVGIKVYLNLAPAYIPRREIRIFDYLPHHLLECIDANGWIVMLHIPRDKRLGDPVNLAQMLEIEKRYPHVRLIIAHVGRAYCAPDVGDAFEVLQATERMFFDISANCNADVFERLIRCVGPKRILFGSDLPILRMRTRRICEQGKYINLVPKGLYGDVSSDPHMREVTETEAEKLTFFMYEELAAFRQAAEKNSLTAPDLRDIFYNNAKDLIVGTGQFQFGALI